MLNSLHAAKTALPEGLLDLVCGLDFLLLKDSEIFDINFHLLLLRCYPFFSRGNLSSDHGLILDHFFNLV